jgi:hypothetical protein
MADSDSVLKEFLISLGFHVQAEEHQKWNRAIKLSTEEVGKLGLAVGAVSTALIDGMKRISDQFADLGYLSQKLSTSTENLQYLALGFKQVGGSIGDVVSQGNVMRQLLQNPIQKAVLAQWLGVDPKSITDAKVGLDDLIKRFSVPFQQGGIQRTMAENMLRALGFSPDALTPALMNPKAFFEGEQQQADIYKILGIDTDELAKKSMELNRQWNLLGAEIGGAGDKLTALFIDPAISGLKIINKEVTDLEKSFGALDPAMQRLAGGAAAIAGAAGGIAAAVKVGKGILGVFGLGGGAGAAAKAGGALAEGGAITAATGAAKFGLGGIASAVAGGVPLGAEAAKLWRDSHPADPNAAPPPGWAETLDNWLKGPLQAILPKSMLPDDSAAGLLHREAYTVPPGNAAPPWLRNAAYMTGGNEVGEDLQSWLRGNAGYVPTVNISGFDQVLDRLSNSLGIGGAKGGVSGSGSPAGAGRPSNIANWNHWANPAPGGQPSSGPRAENRPEWGATAWHALGRGWDEASGLIEHFESGGRNIMNYMNDALHTAGGYFQITNSTWRRYASAVQGAGQFASAISAPFETQKAVAKQIFEHEGFGPWANYDPRLASALGAMNKTALGGDVHHNHHEGDRTAIGHKGDLNVTIHSASTDPNLIATAVTNRHSRTWANVVRLTAPTFT